MLSRQLAADGPNVLELAWSIYDPMLNPQNDPKLPWL